MILDSCIPLRQVIYLTLYPRAMSGLSSMLEFSNSGGTMLPPVDAHIHVSDTLDAHGQFILFQYAVKTLQQSGTVIWVSARADGQAHLMHIARKAVRVTLRTHHRVFLSLHNNSATLMSRRSWRTPTIF